MKKISVYFTDRQSDALEAKAAQAGVTFAEALRRALDEWLASTTERRPMEQKVSAEGIQTVYIRVIDEDCTRVYRNAWVEEDDFNHLLFVYAEREGKRKTLARFSTGDVSSWYIEEPASPGQHLAAASPIALPSSPFALPSSPFARGALSKIPPTDTTQSVQKAIG